ncbi:hypothetical protein ACS127_16060 [Amphibacillus sp. Q70]|uniref:hypothetical protein n=1 Tax=Amphibacillus sp. Q70 TaxID=3453416 RepID=UPI003F833642
MKIGEIVAENRTFYLSSHARERIRQRLNIESESTSLVWIMESIASTVKTIPEGITTKYITEVFEIICEGPKLITVVLLDSSNTYKNLFKGVVTKEFNRLLTIKKRELKKAEIAVCETQLNSLRLKIRTLPNLFGKI